jgi:hypothetical protein
MSARDRLELVLLKYFSGTEDVTRESAGELERLQAGGLIDDFAHELAEEIRAHASVHAKPGSVGYAGILTGANLIDPDEEW